MTVDEDRLWSGRDVRLAVVIRGDHSRAWVAQEEVFKWLARHRERLWRCVFRVAWIFEDELMRRSAERWLSLVGDRLRSAGGEGVWMSHTRESEHDHQSTAAEWAVYQCVNGCVHVRLQHVTLTFSPCEFTQLAQLVDEACVRLGLRTAVAAVRPH